MTDVKQIERIFKFEGKVFADPDPNMSPERVLQFYSMEHPELATGVIEGPKYEKGKAIFTMGNSYKPKG